MALPTAASIGNPKTGSRQVQGFGIEAATGDTTILAAVTGKSIRVQKIIVSVSANLDTSVIALEDGVGGSRIWQIISTENEDPIIEGTHLLDFGESGLMLTNGGLLNLTVETANSTVHCVAVGYVV